VTTNPTDHEWVREALGRHEGRLVAYATHLLRDPERARDVVQDTFLRLCRQERSRVEDHLVRWLYTVCRNRAMDYLRKEGLMVSVNGSDAALLESTQPGPAAVVELGDQVSALLRNLALLPDRQREVIRLKFQGGLTYREISRVTGYSVTNVGFLLHRGLNTLRKRLGAAPTERAARGGAR
jgi:RNA polymerase sigma-70 factor (ECF subfamily)